MEAAPETTSIADTVTDTSTDASGQTVAGSHAVDDGASSAAPAAGTDANGASVDTSTQDASGKSAEATPFDPDAWDGAIETLPETVRDLVAKLAERKGRDLEGGYTKKFQSLAAERKAWEEEQARQKAAWEDRDATYKLYKELAEGAEDPRVATTARERDEWRGKHEQSETARAKLQQEFDAYRQQQDQAWLSGYRERHKDILGDDKKRAELDALLEAGWEEEAAAELVGTPETLRKAAEQIVRDRRLGPDGHRFAIEHARLSLGLVQQQPRKPRPAATVTNGANGQVNPSRVHGDSVRDLSREDARRAVATKAAAKGARA